MKWGAVIGGAIAALATLPVSLPAQAADMTLARPAVSGYIPAQFYWTGFYMGAGFGGGWASTTFVDPFTGQSGSPAPRGFLATGIAGINYQIGAVVIGAEGDFTGAWTKGSVVDVSGNNLNVSTFWTASITGRVGIAFDRLLIYGKGGAAFDYDRDTVTLLPGTATVVGSLYRAGWTVGGGLEYAITDHWTGRIEYDYLKFASKTLSFQGNGTPTPMVGFVGGAIGVNISELKGIVAYKF
jgi:outer membrane immunogenic protein